MGGISGKDFNEGGVALRDLQLIMMVNGDRQKTENSVQLWTG